MPSTKKQLPVVQILFDAEASPKAKMDPSVGGAWITAYIQTSDVMEAVIGELRAATKAGWRVLAVDCARIYTGPKLRDKQHKGAFEQALREGDGRVFNCYPKEQTVPATKQSTTKKKKKKK